MALEPRALASLDDLATRLPFVMDEDEEREALGVLEDLSDDARFYGKVQWATPETSPRQVRNIVLRAAVRHMKNYDGLVQSRAGDESLTWTDRGEDAGSAYFTTREIATLKQMAGNQGNGFHSIQATAWGNGPRNEGVLIKDSAIRMYVPGTEL